MTGNDAGTILIATASEDAGQRPRVERGAVGSLGRKVISTIGVGTLKKNMKDLFGHLQDILQPESGRIGSFKVDRVELYVQVTGEGKLCILGSGTSVEAGGSLKLVLTQVEEDEKRAPASS